MSSKYRNFYKIRLESVYGHLFLPFPIKKRVKNFKSVGLWRKNLLRAPDEEDAPIYERMAEVFVDALLRFFRKIDHHIATDDEIKILLVTVS